MDLLNKKNCLLLNKNWQSIGVKSGAEALVMVAGESAIALNIDNVLESIVPAKWAEWVTLPVREQDDAVGTVRGKIRIPTVIVAINYAKMPVKTFKPTKQTLYRMQKGLDGYTGRPMSYNSSSIDHVLPKSRGGGKNFENLLLTEKSVNEEKDNRTPEEAGLIPLFRHKTPPPIPATAIIELAHPDWRFFLHK